MTPFATLETPGGFPMPELPKRTDNRGFVNNQENDVDYCVRQVILQKDWTIQIYDDDAIQNWSKQSWSCSNENDAVLSYAVQECRWRHKQWQKDRDIGTPAAICKAGLVLAKDGLGQELRASIMGDLKTLQQNEEESGVSTMARHPKYKKIHHLVHPSLYAYEKGVTHVLPEVGAEAVSAPSWNTFLGFDGVVNADKPLRPDVDGARNDSCYGRNYHGTEVESPTAAECSLHQWMPSEFFVASSSSASSASTCQINSYINNLHPIKYEGLYNKIGELFLETLPMMEEVLSEVNDNGKVRKQLPRFESETRPQGRGRSRFSPQKKIEEPPIPSFVPPKYTAKKKAVSLHDRPLQVIVKVISMELQPLEPDYASMTEDEKDAYADLPVEEKPQYFPGGHWHVEGTRDERIVASACCYLDSENVTEKGLEFRNGSVGSIGRELGTVETSPGRILVWPNYLHHKTGGVSLKDKKRAGHRTLCCFHLVDPTLRIRSTATVPPQQRSWLWSMANNLALAPLPSDGLVRSKIHDFMVSDGSTISYEEALERRERLSRERWGDARVIADNFWIPCD